MLLLLLLAQAAAPVAGTQATVVVAYAINAEGRIEDCAIVQSSGQPTLDATACRLLAEKGRFTPKRDERGKPVRVDRREQRISFKIDG